MKRLSIIVVVAAVGILAFTSVNGSAQAPGSTTLQFFESEKGGKFGFVDNPPKMANRRNGKVSVGDQSRTTRLGMLNVQCTVTRPGSEAKSESICVGAVRLNNGTITISGTLKGDPRTVVVPVTGGSGAYIGARGEFSSTNVTGGSNDTITLLP